MKKRKRPSKHIFCIEGSWSNDFKDKASILAALEFLKCNAEIDFIRKECIEPEAFKVLLQTAMQKGYVKYGIVYLAFHGSSRCLHIGKRKKIDLAAIADIIEDSAQNKIIHFGSCSTLKGVTAWELKRFLNKTGAAAISGYTKDIDFIESTVLDILYFKKCQQYIRTPLVKTQRDMKQYYGKLIAELGFKIYFNKK